MKILFGTGNPGKLKEVRELFSALGHDVVQLRDRYPEVQADTLEEVVQAGLEWLWKRHGAPVIIDDSGLFIDALKGFPGVYSAYAFKTLGCQGILRLMEEEEDRRAVFRCCAGFVNSRGSIITRTGAAEGRIIREMRGTGGFGYDPVFLPDGCDKTFAEMDTDTKNRISHRGRAFSMLAEALGE